jgi:hypothetical protein
VTGDDRPWWASDEATTTDPLDPVDAHRAARRGGIPGEDWDLPLLDGLVGAPRGAGTASPDDDAERAHGPDVCGVCPICLALRTLGGSRPQLVEHLTEAARHLAAAVRDLLEDPPRPRTPPAPPPDDDGLQRIDLD